MHFKRSLLLSLAVLALGALPACSSDEGDDDNRPDSGTTGNPDAGNFPFPDAGSDPGTSPTATCPSNAVLCEPFSSGTSGWTPATEHATIEVTGGKLHVVTQDGLNETRGDGQAIARLLRNIPAFGTQLFVRAHVFLTSLPGDLGQMGTLFVLFSDTSSDFGGIELQVIKDTGFALDDWSAQPGQGWNRQGPPVNLGMSTGRWVCLEWEVRRSSAAATHGNARVYVDGALAHDFTGIGMRPFNTFMVGYGFVHPQGPSGSEAWIDNVAVSSTGRIGCQ